MRRAVVLGSLLVIGVLSLNGAATQPGERVVEVEQVRDNLYVLTGGGGNSAAFITSNGVVLVDTKLAGWGQSLIDKVGELTSSPITTIINTHTHFDHVSGNAEFPTTVEIVTHENTARLMGEWNMVTGLPMEPENVFEASGGQGMPTQTFADRLTLGIGSDRVDLYYFGRAHTGGDTWVVFPSLRVMHSGDAFPGKNLPIMDTNNGGSGVDFADTLWNAYSGVQEIDSIITGHSALMSRDDLKEYASFVGNFVSAARAANRDGMSAADFANSWQVPPRYRGYSKPPPARLAPYVQVIYDEIAVE